MVLKTIELTLHPSLLLTPYFIHLVSGLVSKNSGLICLCKDDWCISFWNVLCPSLHDSPFVGIDTLYSAFICVTLTFTYIILFSFHDESELWLLTFLFC